MMDAESDALFTDLARALVARSRSLRAQLAALNTNDYRWDPLFKQLVVVDDDIRSMRGQPRYARSKDTR